MDYVIVIEDSVVSKCVEDAEVLPRVGDLIAMSPRSGVIVQHFKVYEVLHSVIETPDGNRAASPVVRVVKQ